MSSSHAKLASLDAKLISLDASSLLAAQLWGLTGMCGDMCVALANVLPLSAGEEWNIVRDNVS